MQEEYPQEVVLSIQEDAILRVKLKEVVERHATLTGERVTYARLAAMTGIALSTIESLASRRDYNPTLRTLARICVALNCSPGELLELDRLEPARNEQEGEEAS
ncbi:helix-turn-helix domain-containing protein [Roseateles sp. NT4]|uniref:helix-turn-helix domain-containing protein n=1 Tax=Roseateles sp. NT4 TaxID=3453715 RepID=UPI003EED79FA